MIHDFIIHYIYSLYDHVHNTVQKSKAYTRVSPLNTKTKLKATSRRDFKNRITQFRLCLSRTENAFGKLH